MNSYNLPIILILLLIFFPIRSGFLWNLFGMRCNCCQCGQFQQSNNHFSQIFYPQNRFYQSTLSPPSPVYQNFEKINQNYQFQSEQLIPFDHRNIRPSPIVQIYEKGGPPGHIPTSREELDHIGYSTDQFQSKQVFIDSSPSAESEMSKTQIISQLEQELSSEKYKFIIQKQNEIQNNKRKERIKVFRIHNNRHNNRAKNRISWHRSQAAKYSNEKGIESFSRILNNGKKENNFQQGFIPIQIGTEPELANSEPAGPPPNVRNKIFHDEFDINLKRRIKS